MKRGGPLPRGDKPLARRTPLSQGDKGLSRGTPLARGDSTLARTAPIARTSTQARPKAHKPAKPGVTPGTRAIVLARCDGRCEACGKPLGQSGVDLHHRQPRRGGNHSPANVVALHPSCHTIAPEAVHQRPAWARERGLIVRSTEAPATVPLVLPSGRRVLLGESYEDAPPIAA